MVNAARWFRESRWALLALAVLVPAAIVTAFAGRFQPYLDRTAVEPMVAGIGDAVEYAGSSFTLTDLRVVSGEDVGAPVGRDIVVATWDVDVEEPPALTRCETAAVATVDGIDREWEADPFLSYDLGIVGEPEEFCDLSERGSFELLQTYLVPAGLLEAPVVEISSPAESPVVLRFTE